MSEIQNYIFELSSSELQSRNGETNSHLEFRYSILLR